MVAASMAAAETTLKVAITTLPPRMGNPFATSATPSITTLSAMYDGLTRIEADGRLIPWLAVSWRAVDARTWRFELRRDVMFSNDVPLTSEAVVAAVDYLVNRAAPTDNLRRDLPVLETARAVDRHTVEIVTKFPEPSMPRYASVLALPEPGAFRDLGRDGFNKAPVATGPFIAEAFEPNRAVFRAFKGGWRPPRVDRLELIELPDATARLQAILTGAVHIATGLNPEDLAELEAAGHTGLSWQDGTVSSISLVTTRALPFNDVRVRLALNHAVNRAPIIAELLHGRTVSANQPAARGVHGRDGSIPDYDYDPDKAKRLLAEAGYAKGFSCTLETSGFGGASVAAYQQVAADLARVGVTMDIRTLQGPQYLANMFNTGQYADAVTVPWVSAPTVDVIRPILIHSCRSKFAWFCEPSLTPLIEAAQAEWDETKALDLRRQLSRAYHDLAPAIFLYEQVMFTGQHNSARGFSETFGMVAYDRIEVLQ